MSSEKQNGEHQRPRQEPDRVRSRAIVTIGAVGLAVFAVGIAWAVQIQRAAGGGSVRAGRVTTAPRLAGRQEIGIVYQPPFDGDQPISAAKRNAQERHLRAFGWVDKPRQIVFIPIDQAMQRVAEGGKL